MLKGCSLRCLGVNFQLWPYVSLPVYFIFILVNFLFVPGQQCNRLRLLLIFEFTKSLTKVTDIYIEILDT